MNEPPLWGVTFHVFCNLVITRNTIGTTLVYWACQYFVVILLHPPARWEADVFSYFDFFFWISVTFQCYTTGVMISGLYRSLSSACHDAFWALTHWFVHCQCALGFAMLSLYFLEFGLLSILACWSPWKLVMSEGIGYLCEGHQSLQIMLLVLSFCTENSRSCF